MANSSMLVLPSITAPAALRRTITVASYGGTKFSRIFEEQVVRTPLVQITSLMARGTPSRGLSGLPAFRRFSVASARARADSRVRVR